MSTGSKFQEESQILLDIGCADRTIPWDVSKKEQVFAVGIEPAINWLKLARHKINSIRAVGEVLPIKLQ